MIKVMSKTTTIMRIIIAGFLSFLGTLTTAQATLYILFLVGDNSPNYQLMAGIIAGLLGLFVGGLITTRAMDAEDVWFSAFNGLLVGGLTSYILLGLDILVVGITVLSFVIAGLGGLVGLRKQTLKTASPPPQQDD